MVVASQLALGSKRCEYYRFEQQKQLQQQQQGQAGSQTQTQTPGHPRQPPPAPGTTGSANTSANANNTVILAFSDVRRYGTIQEDKFVKLKIATESGHTLLSDRKGWFDHLTTPNLLKSVRFCWFVSFRSISFTLLSFSIIPKYTLWFDRILDGLRDG